MHKLQTIETLGQRLGDLRMVRQELLPIQPRSRFQGSEILLDRPDHPWVVQGHSRRARDLGQSSIASEKQVRQVVHEVPPAAVAASFQLAVATDLSRQVGNLSPQTSAEWRIGIQRR